MPQVARLDADGIITSVSDVDDNDWVTDKEKGVVKLPDMHDMKSKVGEYYFDFDLNSFMPRAALKDDLDQVIDVLCEIVTHLCEKCDVSPAQEHVNIIRKWLSTPK